METTAHRNLKRLALGFLRQSGCQAMTSEVRCPISRYRIDAAGYLDRLPTGVNGEPPSRCEPRTIVIECKQSREDFLRDAEDTGELLARRAQLERIRQSIEEFRIKRCEPQLRRAGTSLFPELDDWDFASSRLPAYRTVLRQLLRIDQKLHGETKFFLIARYHLADQMYLAAPRKLIRRSELPSGWGLLECDPKCLVDFDEPGLFEPPAALQISVLAPQCPSPSKFRLRMLRNIAVAASAAAQRHSSWSATRY
jgi:hypothetical protein